MGPFRETERSGSYVIDMVKPKQAGKVCQAKSGGLSQHNRNVRIFSTIEMSAYGHFSLNDRHGWFGAGRRGSFFSGEGSDAGTEGGRSPTGVPASDPSPDASPALS